MQPYQGLAKFYDLMMRDYNYEGIIDTVNSHYSLIGKKGLELCCGTGKASQLLCKLGAKLTASDLSYDMLDIANSVTNFRPPMLTFTNLDINNFKIDMHYDFVASICDGLNYLEPNKFYDFFAKIDNCLREQGCLFFDISTQYKLTNINKDNVFFEDTDEYTYLFCNKLNSKSCYVDMDVCIFEPQKNQLYSRCDDHSRQYYYPNEQFISTLKNLGLNVIALDGETFKPVTLLSKRMLIIAQKK